MSNIDSILTLKALQEAINSMNEDGKWIMVYCGHKTHTRPLLPCQGTYVPQQGKFKGRPVCYECFFETQLTD